MDIWGTDSWVVEEELLFKDDQDKTLVGSLMDILDMKGKGRLPKKTTNFGFWLELRWVGVDRGPGCPTPLTGF